MRRVFSIKARLSFFLMFSCLCLLVLGIASLRSLSDVNDASAEIRRDAVARDALARFDTAYAEAQRRIVSTLLLSALLLAGAGWYAAGARRTRVWRDKRAQPAQGAPLQRDFVSMAAHELRTPLGIIDGHAQRLISMRERLSPDELAERARKIRSAVARMTQLMTTLRIGFSPQLATIDVTALLREACQVQEELTPEAQILVCLGDEPLRVLGDAQLLGQVFGNLLGNAVKYSRLGGPVKLTSFREGLEIVVVIEDRGIGIPETDRQRIFERHYRGGNTTGIVGSGVGLYLVKTIVDLHRGAIAVEPQEHDGARFVLRLPGCAPPAEVAAAAPRRHSPLSAGTFS